MQVITVHVYKGRHLSCCLAWILEIITIRNVTGKRSELSSKSYECNGCRLSERRPEVLRLGFLWFLNSETDTKGISLSQFGGNVNSLKQEHQLSMGNLSATKKSLNCSHSARLELIKRVFHISWQWSAFPLAQDNQVSQPRFSFQITTTVECCVGLCWVSVSCCICFSRRSI